MKYVLVIIIAVFAYSCESEEEERKREIEEDIYSSLTMQAKFILNNPETYEFENMKDFRVNDSIRVYAQKFSGANSFGVRESKYAIGYFNINTGEEVYGDMLELVASDKELKMVKQAVGAK